MTWFIFILVIIAILPFLREAFRPTMSDRARKSAPGDFVRLSQGVTHYEWKGARTGPVAVCVHGLTSPSFVWGPVARGLGDLGFRVLVYDLYGRGYSDRPGGQQDGAFFNQQLADLLAHLNVENDITLLGYSMGGAIAPGFAAAHPDMLRQMVLIAPAGLGHDLGPASRLMANLGVFGTWLTLLLYGRSLRRSCEAERGLPGSIKGVVDLQLRELRYRGFITAVLSSLRGVLDYPLEDTHRAIAETGLPVLAIWAENDDIIPLSGRDTLTEWNAASTNIVIPDTGHTLTYTDDAAVVSALGNHLIR